MQDSNPMRLNNRARRPNREARRWGQVMGSGLGLSLSVSGLGAGQDLTPKESNHDLTPNQANQDLTPGGPAESAIPSRSSLWAVNAALVHWRGHGRACYLADLLIVTAFTLAS